jgi:hypothetical protein
VPEELNRFNTITGYMHGGCVGQAAFPNRMFGNKHIIIVILHQQQIRWLSRGKLRTHLTTPYFAGG